MVIRLRSTSRAPWKALKKTTKNTSTTARTILELTPKPKATTKIDARTMRGMELPTLMKGDEHVGEEAAAAQHDAEDDAEGSR